MGVQRLVRPKRVVFPVGLLLGTFAATRLGIISVKHFIPPAAGGEIATFSKQGCRIGKVIVVLLLLGGLVRGDFLLLQSQLFYQFGIGFQGFRQELFGLAQDRSRSDFGEAFLNLLGRRLFHLFVSYGQLDF